MKIFMPNRILLILFTLAVGLLMMFTPVHAEQDSGSILAADAHLENSQRNVRDKNLTILSKGDHKGGKKTLKIRANFRKSLATNESLSLSPPQNLRIITDPR